MAARKALIRWVVLEAEKSWKEVAALLDISRQAMSKLKSGKSKPSRQTAVKLEQITEGKVPASLWDEPAANDQRPRVAA